MRQAELAWVNSSCGCVYLRVHRVAIRRRLTGVDRTDKSKKRESRVELLRAALNMPAGCDGVPGDLDAVVVSEDVEHRVFPRRLPETEAPFSLRVE
jgi:hypothetical protein